MRRCTSACRKRRLDPGRVELERAAADDLPGGRDLREHARDVDAAMRRRERAEPPSGLLELRSPSRPPAAAGLVPGHRHVDEPLVEVALLRGAARQASSSSSCASK